MFRWKRAAAVAALVGLGLTGCSAGTGSSSSTGASGGTLTLGAALAPRSFAAAEAQWANESILQQPAYDTLLHAEAEDNTPIPWLATEWSYDEARTVLTMTLRDDVTFSDGTKFDAEAAAQNLLRFRDGSAADKSHLAALEDAAAIDATTLQLTLSAPDPAMLTYLSQAPGLMESPAAFESATVDTVPVGSGPYVMDTGATVTGSKYVFTRNPDYWAKEQQHFDRLVINILPTGQNQLNAVKGGQVDGLVVGDVGTIDQITSTPGFTVVQQEFEWEGIVIFDRDGTVTPALKDVRVRQALNYAIDRDAILQANAKGNGTVTTSVFPTYSPGYDAELEDAYPFDPAKAKQLLAEAGYPAFDITMPRIAGFGEVANDLMKQYLADVGITVTFENVPVANVISDVLAPKYSAAYFRLQEDTTAYQEVNFLLSKDAVFNPYKVEDPKIEAWAETIKTGTPEEGDAATAELNRYVVDQAIMNPWYRVKNTFAVGPRIEAKTQAGNTYPYLYNITPKG